MNGPLSIRQDAPPNDIEFSGERKRVRCNELLGGALGGQHDELLTNEWRYANDGRTT